MKLNIGGSYFETSVETLTCEPGSMLEAMFSGRFAIEKDEDGASFIDRDQGPPRNSGKEYLDEQTYV